mgnify:CR=1 FL=1
MKYWILAIVVIIGCTSESSQFLDSEIQDPIIMDTSETGVENISMDEDVNDFIIDLDDLCKKGLRDPDCQSYCLINQEECNNWCTDNQRLCEIHDDSEDQDTLQEAPAKCPPIIQQNPVNIRLATSILYPGQERGGHYKAHGGFRFDDSGNEITVSIAMDGQIISGSRYIEGGHVQYLFDIKNKCNVVHRFDHLLELTPKFAEIAEQFRPAVEDDSRTTNIDPVKVEVGEIIATSVGVKNNVFLDFGVYDLNNKNKASQDPVWEAEYGNHQTSYALCWLDLLPEGSDYVKGLPGSGQKGKTSDYC